MLDKKKIGLKHDTQIGGNLNTKPASASHKTMIEPHKKAVVASSMMKLLETNQPMGNGAMGGKSSLLNKSNKASNWIFGKKTVK